MEGEISRNAHEDREARKHFDVVRRDEDVQPLTARNESTISATSGQKKPHVRAAMNEQFDRSASLSLRFFSKETNQELLDQILGNLPSFVADLARTANNTCDGSIKHHINVLCRHEVLNRPSRVGAITLTIAEGKNGELETYLTSSLKKIQQYLATEAAARVEEEVVSDEEEVVSEHDHLKSVASMPKAQKAREQAREQSDVVRRDEHVSPADGSSNSATPGHKKRKVVAAQNEEFDRSASLSLRFFSKETNQELLDQILGNLPSFVADLARTANNTYDGSIKHHIDVLCDHGILSRPSRVGAITLTMAEGKNGELEAYLTSTLNEIQLYLAAEAAAREDEEVASDEEELVGDTEN